MNKTMNTEIATTIISQFGRMFPQMVGLKSVVAIDGGVQFGFAKGHQGINKVVITLNVMDTYDVTFYKMGRNAAKEIISLDGIYADQLGTEFEAATGLFTHL